MKKTLRKTSRKSRKNIREVKEMPPKELVDEIEKAYNEYKKEKDKLIELSEKRIEELENQLAISEHDREHNDYELTEVYKENEELKTDKQYWKQKANRLTIEWGVTLDQLAQAKDLLKKMYYLYHEPCVTHKDLENRDKLFEEVKQFLKEIVK